MFFKVDTPNKTDRYGIFLDDNDEYKTGVTAYEEVKFAEQNFHETCVGINLAAGIPKQLDDLFSFGVEFSTGSFHHVGTLSVPYFLNVSSHSLMLCLDQFKVW